MGTNGERTQWQDHISKTLEDLHNKQDFLHTEFLKNRADVIEKIANVKDDIKGDLNEFKISTSKDISVLKVKAGVWGTIAGALTAGIAALLKLLSQ